MLKNFGKISIVDNSEECYFHVLGDKTMYFDLESLVSSHEELSDYVSKNRYEINRELYHARELQNGG